MRGRTASELTFRCHRCSTRNNDKSSKKQGFGWEVGTWANLLFISHRCSNWGNNVSKEKQGMEWVIEEWLSLLLSDERWSKWGNDQSREEQEIEWDIQDWSKLPLNDGLWIKSNWINNQSREKEGLNEKSQSDWTYFPIRHLCFNWDKHLHKDNQGIEWKIEVIEFIFVGHRCFNECIDLSREKQTSELNIEGWWS